MLHSTLLFLDRPSIAINIAADTRHTRASYTDAIEDWWWRYETLKRGRTTPTVRRTSRNREDVWAKFEEDR